MIIKSELSNVSPIDVYLFESEENGEILKHTFFETVNIYEVNEFILFKEKEKYYVMGATPKTKYFGYEITKEESERIKEDFQLIETFRKYDYMSMPKF